MTRWALFAAVPLLVAAAVSLAFVLRSSGSSTTSTVVPVADEAARTVCGSWDGDERSAKAAETPATTSSGTAAKSAQRVTPPS